MKKDIKGYEGLYAVTEDGRIWSYPKTWEKKPGFTSQHKGVWLKTTLGKNGYPTVGLYKNKINKRYYVHILVAKTFVKKPTLIVNHKDGDKTNNKIKNLEWVTPRENIIHATQVLKVGRCQGEKHRLSKLKENEVLQIRELSKAGLSHRELSKNFNVDASVICRVVNRQTWKHI